MKNSRNHMHPGMNKIALCTFLLLVMVMTGLKELQASGLPVSSGTQQTNEKRVTLNVQNRTLVSILSEIKNQTGLVYGFRDNRDATSNERYSINVTNVTVEEALTTLLKDSKFTFEINDGVILILTKVAQAAQQIQEEDLVVVKGRVLDDKGAPLPGAAVIIHGTTQGVSTDSDGRYTLRVRPDDVLRFTFIGYKDEVVPIEGKETVNVRLESESAEMEEAVVVAFGTQKKESIVSAITTVRPMDLKSSSSDLTTQLAGKVAGIVGWQTGGLPGALTEEEMNTKFYIRGITSFQTGANIDPLILIDGVESSKLELSRMVPEDIESFSVMKDASATAMYGARGANGVILVTTKKGEEGSVYTSVRYEAVASMPTREIDVVDPIQYMRLYNEAGLSRGQLTTPRYTAQDISRRQNKNFPSWAYPANDWYDILFKDFSMNHRLGVNIRGGSNVMQYYASINYIRDLGMIKTDKLNDFDVNIKNGTLSFRVNLNVNLHPQIRLLYTSSTNWDKYQGPKQSVSEAYGLAFKADPVAFAPTYPADDTYAWEHIRFGAYNGEGDNPYAEIQSGYLSRNRYSTTNQLEYIHNLSSLVKGLELRGRVALSQTGYYSTPYTTSPFFYRLQEYNESTNKHVLVPLNADSADPTITMGDGTTTSETQLMYEIRAYHTAAWKDHQTSLTAVFNAMQATETGATTYLESIERRNLGFSMRAAYGYKDRYFLEGSFGYNGSERFAKKNKMGFFPAVGAAYVLSSEPWMMGAQKWLPFLKLRASWGKVGNDGIINRPRFVHLEEVDKNNVSSVQPGGGSVDGWTVANYANEDIQWEVAEQVNFGVEAKMFNGIFEFTLDAYQEIRHNILSYRLTIPDHVGIQNNQLDNVGKVRSRGLDLSAKIQHAFSPDFWIILNGTMTYNKAIYKYIEEPTEKPYWQSNIGHEISQQIGFIDQGLFRDQYEVDNAPQQNGEYEPGDIRYRDVTGDGKISIEDAVHIGFPETPRFTYGFNGFITYKNWEFNFAFQGSGKRGFFINPASISPFYSGAVLQAIADDHWTPENMAQHPLWPRLSLNNITLHNNEENYYGYETDVYKSTYFMRECRFLRCTALELAYNLPDKLKKKLRMQNVKFFARANNPFIISNFDLWDVELGENGFNYPIQKTFALGLNFSF